MCFVAMNLFWLWLGQSILERVLKNGDKLTAAWIELVLVMIYEIFKMYRVISGKTLGSYKVHGV